MKGTAEHKRLADHRARKANWRNWGPYLSERAWGTVREDYSPDGKAWDYFTHDDARSRAYRWNEDGLAGISDRGQFLCFALALWNGKDDILKERLFGLSGKEGNHGEDVKEYYFYLDNTPTHSYMKMLYKYPQNAFPYKEIISANLTRGYQEPEYELIDTGIFKGNAYFDIFIEYTKADQNDILIQISITNRASETSSCTILPTLWYRNTWSWGYDDGPMGLTPRKPQLCEISTNSSWLSIKGEHPTAGNYYFYANNANELIFTNNETNFKRVFSGVNESPYVKDSFHRYIVENDPSVVNPLKIGTKAAAVFYHQIPPTETKVIQLRLTDQELRSPFKYFSSSLNKRKVEAEEFYLSIQNPELDSDDRRIQRQAFASMLWTKQLYYFDIEQWLNGDPKVQPPESRRKGRNKNWQHLINFDIISMPDKWEYPWYATWDLAFHCLSLALIDPDFAKRQLTLFTRVWYMHPNGQLPAYEWEFDDVNPPVHAWATWQVYKIDGKLTGKPDRPFLESIFHKLLLNFTWWTNKKDEDGNNIFQGGFLGLDNISVFNRSEELPLDGHLDQADGTAWMAAYCLTMLKITLELAVENPIYQDIATKFFEHFLRIAHSMIHLGSENYSLWDDADGFFYDALHLPGGETIPIKARSTVGLLPLIAVELLELEHIEKNPTFYRRMCWFFDNRPHLSVNMTNIYDTGQGDRHIFSLLTKERLIKVLRRLLDESEFLSDYGIRSLSKFHKEHPFTFYRHGRRHTLAYWPGEAQSGLFGGNSNWRGPIWLPINFLIIESLQKYHKFYGNDLKVECPTGSGKYLNLKDISKILSQRLINLFRRNDSGRRPIQGEESTFQNDPNWKDLILFYEYFHGDNGKGLGASHQTGWTGLVANLIHELKG
jgi:hypothetical protein